MGSKNLSLIHISGLTNEEHHVEDSLFLYHDVCTNGIGYADLLFEIHDFDVDTVHYLSLIHIS